ncbi:MAG: hypothetical protein ACKVVP_20875 [Chloroflexota bacterium]
MAYTQVTVRPSSETDGMRLLGLLVLVLSMVAGCRQALPELAPTAPSTTVPRTTATLPPASLEATPPPAPPPLLPAIAKSSPTPMVSPARASVCDHPFFPVDQAIRWTYRVRGAVPTQYIEIHQPDGAAGFVARMVFTDTSVDNQWRCTSDGLVALQPWRAGPMQSHLRFVSTNVSGVTIPEASQWVPGATWSTVYSVDADRTVQNGNPARGRISLQNRIEQEESISVPAGSFTAIRVQQRAELDLTVEVRQISAPMNVSVESTSWFSRGVGLVKSVGGGELGEATTELVAWTR